MGNCVRKRGDSAIYVAVNKDCLIRFWGICLLNKIEFQEDRRSKDVTVMALRGVTLQAFSHVCADYHAMVTIQDGALWFSCLEDEGSVPVVH